MLKISQNHIIMNKQDGKDTVNKITSHVEKIKQIAWNQKWTIFWHLGASSLALGASLGGTIEITAICTGISCQVEIPGHSAVGDAISAGLECPHIYYQHPDGKISGSEAVFLASTAIVSTCASTATFMVASNITDTLIATWQISPEVAIELYCLTAIGVALEAEKPLVIYGNIIWKMRRNNWNKRN